MPHFILKGKTGAHVRPPGVTIPAKGSRPLEVDEEMAKKIRALNHPMIMECDENCCPIEAKPEEKPKAKAKAKPKAKPKAKKPAEEKSVKAESKDK